MSELENGTAAKSMPELTLDPLTSSASAAVKSEEKR